jgi:dihydrofolate synthase/folylpolyglutamate synthase
MIAVPLSQSFPPIVELGDLLDPFQTLGVNLGLHRIRSLLHRLDHPEQQVPIIHVGGSNGKGSVCNYLYQVLWKAGYRVGCYTSPHLVSWCERIQFCGDYIAPADLRRVLRETIAAIDETEPVPTLFEVFTAAAWLYFAQQRADLLVMEVGLGGRLDATNVKEEALATVITSISREHWQILGDTLGAIATEKAGIFKTHCPAIIGPLPAEAKAVMMDRLSSLPCPVTWVRPALPTSPPEGQASQPLQWLRYGDYTYAIQLPGAVQRVNSAIALATLEVLQHQGWFLSPVSIQEGMAATHWPGRLQWITWNQQPVLLDGAHNPAAAIALRSYVDDLKGMGDAQASSTGAQTGSQIGVHWIMGMLSTKDHRDILQALLRPGDRLQVVPVPGHSSADPERLKELALTLVPNLAGCEAYEDLFAALEEVGKTEARCTVVCGSLYLLGYFFATARSELLSY